MRAAFGECPYRLLYTSHTGGPGTQDMVIPPDSVVMVRVMPVWPYLAGAMELRRHVPKGGHGAIDPAEFWLTRCNLKCPMFKCQILNIKCRMWNVECSMSNVECQMLSVECQMWNFNCQMWNVECQMWNVECAYWNVEC
jgi:hypothetical protein